MPAPAKAAPTDNDTTNLPEVTSQPSDMERTAAAVGGIWLGAHAIAMSAPQVPEEEPADPRKRKLKVRRELEEE